MILKMIMRRLMLGAITLFVVSIMVFAGTEILPGDVADPGSGCCAGYGSGSAQGAASGPPGAGALLRMVGGHGHRHAR